MLYWYYKKNMDPTPPWHETAQICLPSHLTPYTYDGLYGWLIMNQNPGCIKPKDLSLLSGTKQV